MMNILKNDVIIFINPYGLKADHSKEDLDLGKKEKLGSGSLVEFC